MRTAAQMRTSRRYKKLRLRFRAECELDSQPCWICRMEIDYSLPLKDPMSEEINEEAWTLDHLYPAAANPELFYDPNNFRASHWKCNNERNDKSPALAIKKPSRQWIA